MKIAVWKTGHEIADTVAHAVLVDKYCGKTSSNDDIVDALVVASASSKDRKPWMEWADVHIGYGILRGMDGIFLEARTMGKPYICLDRGYWKPGHYDGYYRISLNGTQQTTGLDKLEPDYDRWEALGLEILPAEERKGEILFCPPTKDVCEFFNDPVMDIEVEDEDLPMERWIKRDKSGTIPLVNHLAIARKVVTFNSAVGWEALRQGIPVISDPTHSIVGSYMKHVDSMEAMTIDSRRRLFAVMASLQLTLEEIKNGKLWPLLEKLMTSI